MLEHWIPPIQIDYGLGFNEDSRLFILSDGETGTLITNPAKHVSFADQKFLKRKPADTLRVFLIGGSSVRRLEDLQLLKEKLEPSKSDTFRQIEIINAGGSAYGSHRLVKVLIEIINYEPDMVLIYCGHNEFEEAEQLEWAKLDLMGVNSTLSNSAAFRVFRDGIDRYRIHLIQTDRERRALATIEPSFQWAQGRPDSWRRGTFTDESARERLQSYTANLQLMVSLCQERKIPIIIGTVPSNLFPNQIWIEFPKKYRPDFDVIGDDYRSEKYKAASSRFREILSASPGRHQSSDLENQAIRQVAASTNIPIADVEAAIIAAEPHGVPGEALFDDHCHLNKQGNAILISVFADQINQLLKTTNRESN